MEQTKIDKSVREWFQAKRRLEEAKSEVNSADTSLRNTANGLIKLLLPADAEVGQIYIFQTTDEHFVRVFMKYRTWVGGTGEPKKIAESHVEVHEIKKR